MLLKEAEPRMSEMWKRWQGQVVNGTFPLRQYLGGSKQSAVFLTQHAQRKSQKAAIKLIASDPQNADLQLARWNAAAKLTHPHLIALHNMGRCRLGDIALLFLVMEYAEENLGEILPQRSLTPSEAAAMLTPTLDALAYLHGEGFAHGHLKPGNIMAVGDQLKLSTDGVWWMAEPSLEIGQTGAYDAPEKSSTGISPAGDVWSLGITLVESLTQCVPAFAARQPEPSIPETLPAPFLDIARHCLRRDPQQRWRVAEITSRLHTHEPGLGEAPKPGVPEFFAQRRLIIPAVVIGLALLAMLAGPRLLKRPAGFTPVPSTATKPEVSQGQAQKPRAGQPPQSSPSSQSSLSRTNIRSSPESTDSAVDIASESVPRGEVTRRVMPHVPQNARNTIQGTVKVNVRVRVDASGNVTSALLDSAGPSKYFARLARQAAEQWKFRTANAHRGSREWMLQFQFRRNGPRVHAIQLVR
jgi:TonB family protein